MKLPISNDNLRCYTHPNNSNNGQINKIVEKVINGSFKLDYSNRKLTDNLPSKNAHIWLLSQLIAKYGKFHLAHFNSSAWSYNAVMVSNLFDDELDLYLVNCYDIENKQYQHTPYITSVKNTYDFPKNHFEIIMLGEEFETGEHLLTNSK